MNILLTYSSKTGNTKAVAEAIGEELHLTPVPVEEAPPPDAYDLVLAGFWVDRGTADKAMRDYLAHIEGKSVAVFATLGADPRSPHAEKSLASGAACVGRDSVVVGQFICQGKVDPAVTKMMQRTFPEGHPHAITPERLARIEEASAHPDARDLADARRAFRSIVDAWRDGRKGSAS